MRKVRKRLAHALLDAVSPVANNYHWRAAKSLVLFRGRLEQEWHGWCLGLFLGPRGLEPCLSAYPGKHQALHCRQTFVVVHPPWCREMGASVPLPPFNAPGFVACSDLAVGGIEVVVLKPVTGFPNIGDVVSGGVSRIFALLLAWYCLNQWSRICSFGWSSRC